MQTVDKIKRALQSAEIQREELNGGMILKAFKTISTSHNQKKLIAKFECERKVDIPKNGSYFVLDDVQTRFTVTVYDSLSLSSGYILDISDFVANYGISIQDIQKELLEIAQANFFTPSKLAQCTELREQAFVSYQRDFLGDQ